MCTKRSGDSECVQDAHGTTRTLPHHPTQWATERAVTLCSPPRPPQHILNMLLSHPHAPNPASPQSYPSASNLQKKPPTMPSFPAFTAPGSAPPPPCLVLYLHTAPRLPSATYQLTVHPHTPTVFRNEPEWLTEEYHVHALPLVYLQAHSPPSRPHSL